jgi:hypothetical protein
VTGGRPVLSLTPLLLFTTPALLSGAISYRCIICFLKQPRIVLNSLFGCPLNHAPSFNVLPSVLQTFDHNTLEDAYRRRVPGAG